MFVTQLKQTLADSEAVDLHPIDEPVADKFTIIDRAAIADPWDGLIVATALAMGAPLVTRDAKIRQAGVVHTMW